MGLCLAKIICAQVDTFEEGHWVGLFYVTHPLLRIHYNIASRSLAPGANVLVKPLTDESLPQEQRVDMTKQIRFLTLADWALIERAFEAWPFAPKVCDFLHLLRFW